MSDKYQVRDKYGRTIGSVERQLSPYEQGQRMGEQAAGCAFLIILFLPLFQFLKEALKYVVTAFIVIVTPPFAFGLCMALTTIPVIGGIIGILGFLIFAYGALPFLAAILLQFTEATPLLKFNRNAKWHPFSLQEWAVGIWYLCILGAGMIGFAAGALIQFGIIKSGIF
jgi:hypothetical protein